MWTTADLLALCFWVNAGVHAAQMGPKCGTPQMRNLMVPSLRVVGGTEAAYGSHPWLVSLKNRGSHFCGGAILTERWLMTAAHCFTSVSKEFLSGVRVLVGEFDLRVDDEEEQVFQIKSVSVHEKYNHALPMNYDIALVELDQHIQMGSHVYPICLPLPDENIPPGTSCIVGGWGRTRERGHISAVLREVHLDLVDPAKCKHVLQTLKSSFLSQRTGRLQPVITVLCAGPERGGRDACQGDSGGPLVCPAGSGSSHWVVLGITSWGKGCGRSWRNNSSHHPSRRGSPGIFTDVKLLLPWIKSKLREADLLQGKTSSRLCSVKDGPVSDMEGVIRNPSLPGDHYDNNQLCLWSIGVPAGYSILLEFDHFDVENESYCQYDRLTVYMETNRPVGIFCGHLLPGPVFFQNSQSATLLFSSDINKAGSGFVVRHRAVKGHTHPGCGTVVLVEDQVTIHSPNYPQSYSNDCVLRWVICAPQGHVVKLDFAEFDLEESEICLYDSLTVLGDVEGTEEIALLCGSSIPPPVLSYSSIMVLQFLSDSTVAHKGFRAALTFISITGAVEQQSSSRALLQASVDHEASVNPSPHVSLASDDEDYSGESPGAGQ
ncbi:ovochymase-2 isoform X2 [Melanotaenia boesemani]|uniref:ovochymase-2 isoform X2 n=1 Tax=Melanotaenia boesemani TaxID=1250792 RepID=UPI001C05ED48|nr:ovochymase-2 isoform X2 [Melanotaenia boesemani]